MTFDTEKSGGPNWESGKNNSWGIVELSERAEYNINIPSEKLFKFLCDNQRTLLKENEKGLFNRYALIIKCK